MSGLKNVHNRRDDTLARMGWDRLEAMLAEYYRTQGWSVDHVGTGKVHKRFDGGVDLKLRKDGACVLVQSKHWNAKQVPHNVVHELLGLKTNENATGAIVITSGEFTCAARDAAQRQDHVQLIDGDQLREMLGPRLDALAASMSPPLPGPRHAPRHVGLSMRRRLTILLVTLVIVAFGLYGVSRVLKMPFMSRPISVDLPQRVIPLPPPTESEVRPSRRPVTKTPGAPEAAIQPASSDAELAEWKRRNAESMRILDENEKGQAEETAAKWGYGRAPTG